MRALPDSRHLKVLYGLGVGGDIAVATHMIVSHDDGSADFVQGDIRLGMREDVYWRGGGRWFRRQALEARGYTGSAALATGYTWIEIDGTLYKILDRDSADARYAAAFPAGVMTRFGGASGPCGAGCCARAGTVSRSTYAALFAAIGTTYGVGDGFTTFNVPELRQKFLRGKGASDTRAPRVARRHTRTRCMLR